VFFDFNHPENLQEELKSTFDFILIDPPFITLEVWSKYAETAKFLVKNDEKGEISGKILACSIIENEKMLKELWGAR